MNWADVLDWLVPELPSPGGIAPGGIELLDGRLDSADVFFHHRRGVCRGSRPAMPLERAVERVERSEEGSALSAALS